MAFSCLYCKNDNVLEYLGDTISVSDDLFHQVFHLRGGFVFNLDVVEGSVGLHDLDCALDSQSRPEC